MKKVPDVGVARKRGRPPKKKLAVEEASNPIAAGEGTQSVTGTSGLDVPVVQPSTDTSSSEKRQLSSGLKSRHGSKLASLGPVKITKRKRCKNSSVEANLDVKRPASSSRSSKDKMRTLLTKAVKQKARQVSQHVKSSTLHIISRESKSGLQISQKKKSKLKKFCRSKISRIKSMKTQASELKDSITPEMKRLLTTDGFWTTKASSSPHSQPDDSLVQRHGSAGKKDSRTSTPDVTPSGTRRHSLSKTVTDKDDTAVQRANIPGSELRRLRTTDRFSFRDANVASRTSSRDVSPCSSSSLDRGTRLNSRSFTRSNENKNAMAVDDADTLAVADNVVSARNKMTVKKESCDSKDKLSEDHKEMSCAVSPLTTDAQNLINCESPVSRFKKKHFLDKAANITKHKRLSAKIKSKKQLSLMQRTSRRQRLKGILIPSQSTAGESSMDPNLSTSTNVPKLKKDRQLSRQSVNTTLTEKTPERKRKVKQKQRNISDLGTSMPCAVLEDGSENSHEPVADNISLENNVFSTKSCTSPEFLISDLLDSAELKRLNTTAGFWSSASGIDTFLGIDQPRKLRDADGNSIKEASDCVNPKPARQRKLHLGKFPKTSVTPKSTLLQHRKKKLHSLQSKLVKTKPNSPSNDLAEQQQATMDSIPAPTDASYGRKSRPRARLFGVRKHRRKRSITLDEDSNVRSTQGVQTIGESLNVVHSEATAEAAALLIDANGSQYENEKCMQEERASVNNADRDTKQPTATSDYVIANSNSDIIENVQGIKTFTEPVDLEMDSQTEMPDVEMDTSVNDTTAHKPKRGRKNLPPGEVHATPSSSIRTRGRGKFENTIDSSLEVVKNFQPSNEDTGLSSSPSISKVTSERRKVKKESLARLDFSELSSGDGISSHHAEIAEIRNTQVKDNERDNLSDPKVHKSRGKVGNTVDIPLKVQNGMELDDKDPVLPSASAISKVVSERRRTKKVKKESLAKLDLSELNSGDETDKKSSLDAESADIKNPEMKDNEANSSDSKTSTTELDHIGKHLHVGKQNSLHTKSNLFESLGYSLNMPSETASLSCVNSLVCDVKDFCPLHESVAESLFKTHTLPETEIDCDMKVNDVLHVAQTESSAINISDFAKKINPQELKDAKLSVTGVGKELMNDTLEELSADCLDVCHKDSFPDISGSSHDLQPGFSSENVILSEPAVQGSVKTEALKSTSAIEHNVCEGQDCALAVVPAPEVKADTLRGDHVPSVSSALVESEVSISVESTTASAAELKYNLSEKQFIGEESKIMSENVLSSNSEGSKTEQQVERMKLAEPGVETDAFLPQEPAVSASSGFGLTEQYQDSFTEPYLFSEPERGKANNVSMESVDIDNTEQCEMLKSGFNTATDDTAENVSCNAKSSVEVDKNVSSVVLDSELEIAEPESCEHTNVKSQKRKRKRTSESVGCKMRKHLVETTDTSASLNTISVDSPAVLPLAAFDFSSSEMSKGEQNEGLHEANMVQAPVKKVRKRRRNAWQRGVLKANMSNKPKKSVKKSITPQQGDVSVSVLDSNDEQIDTSVSMLVSDGEQIDKSVSMLISDDDQSGISTSIVVSDVEQIDKSASLLVSNVEQIDKSASVSDEEQIDKSSSLLAPNEQSDKSASVLASNEQINISASVIASDAQSNKSASMLASNEQIDKSASVLASNEQIDKSASGLASNEQVDKSSSKLASSEQIDKSSSMLASSGQIDKSSSMLASSEQIDKSSLMLASNEQIDKSSSMLASNEQIDKSVSVLALNDEQSDMSTLQSVSTHDKVCVPDDTENLDAVTSALISRVMEENQMSGCLNGNNIICPALHSNCDDESQISDGMQTCSESAPTVLIFDSSTKIPYLVDSKIPVSDSKSHIAEDSKTPVSDTSKISVADDSRVQVSVDSKIPVSVDYQKRDVLSPLFSSSCDTTAQLSENVMTETVHQLTDTYTPAVTKSLKNMLKKLQTNANLAHADLGVGSYKGKFLRNIQQKEQKQKRLNARRKLLSADQGGSERMVNSAEPQIGVSEMPVRRKRGRPKKQTGESFPKLTPVGMLPLLRSVTPWNKTPPDLSPHDLTAPQFVDVNTASTQEADIVPESVDDTDLHLYLSGVSDDEKSPKKELGPAWLASFHTDSPVYQEQKDSSIPVYEETKGRSTMQGSATDTLLGAESFTTQKSIVSGGKEPKKRGRPKKGSRGRPPGIPMTEEERLKRKDEEKFKRRKALKVFKEECEDPNFLSFLRTSQRSVDSPDCFTTPAFSGSVPAGSFSLRKKSTRSPLEMLAMKRKQEEAIYDLEQEKRQARLIHLREKRSARESGEGFSDEEVGEDSSENFMTCSVVLNDFVKKLQLDEFEFSSGEEGTHEAPDNIGHTRGSPDYNPSEDRDEDWRADFEEHDSEEWNSNRPSIPRLKLKRIIKKGTQSQIKSTNLTTQTPKERQHVPIKLVIKSEPAGELNEQAGLRLSAGIESSKVERSGFENSFMDFLKKKSHPVPGKSDASKRSHNVSRPSQLQESMQNVAADLSGVEILSLPTLGVRGALAVDTNAFITGVQAPSAARFLSGSSAIGDRAPALAQSRVDANACPLDNLSDLEHTGRAKPLVSVDDDEDDILILDLEDGTVEQNSNDLSHFSSSASSEVGQTSGVASAQESTLENRDSHTGNALLSHLQRSYSNDEMGLMFESYNSQKDPGKLNLCVAQNAGDTFVSISSHFGDLSGNKEANLQNDVAQPLACVLKDTAVKTIVSALQSQTSQSEVQKPHTLAPTVSAEPSRKGTKEIDGSNSAVVSSEITNTEALFNACHTDGGMLTYSKNQSDGDSIHKMNRAEDSMITNSVINASISDGQKEGGVLDSDVLATTQNKAAEYVSGDASTDNNNVTSVCTSSFKTGSFKKPGMAGDNNKSPKHSTYHGSVPEDWRVKVILHSDKFPSGKYSCKRCSFTAPAKLTIESHIYSHIPGVQFRCAYCESEFSSMAATSSHLKNTHSLSEAKLHISRHIDEKNFYDKETAVFSEDSGQQSPVHPASAGTNAGGQSPPVIISVVVSGRGGRSSAPAHRFVCTHCGFSTNVKEDAEHHVLDLHSSQALFACLLCSENVCYTESEIKDHCAVVHPARKHPYKKLPDFYDAELLSLKEKSASQDDRENIFERMSSLFQDETQPGVAAVDHKQKAKEYLYLQEGWREKTKVEADSTTAVDYTDEHDDADEQSAPISSAETESLTENVQMTASGENEVFSDHQPISQVPDVSEGDISETAALLHDDFITSSAVSAANVSIYAQVDSEACSEHRDEHTDQEESFSSQLEELPSHVVLETTDDENIQQGCHIDPDHGVEDDDDGGGMGLKIVQVVSLSEQSEDLIGEQIGAEHVHTNTDGSAGDGQICQIGAVVSEDSFASSKVLEFSASEHSSAPVDNVTLTENSEKETAASGTVVTTESSATDSSATDTSSVSSPIASPSFANGLPLSYKCNACKVHTPYLLMMVKHLKAKHPNMRCFSCPYCKTAQSFVSQKQLRHHVKQSHPNKFGRNEIALSEDAKKFVEAMVLPIGPECIRVGNRIVLEEDIHTCTYCKVKMVSLTSVYEHLNTKHSDLFEFVCPVCQDFRSKLLPEIFEHCLKTHKSSLDTDKVHVSVPKNLFTALTCISRSGKYIEKTLAIGSPGKMIATSSSSTPLLPEKAQVASVPQRIPQLSTGQISSSEQHPLSETSSAVPPNPSLETMPNAEVIPPMFAVPFASSVGAGAAVGRPVVAFSSSLFDTSSLTGPQLAVASHSIPFVQNAAAASFLSPLPQQAHSNPQQMQPGKQSHSKSSERTHGSAKTLPVLNVPTIRPRTSPATPKPVVGNPMDAMQLSASNSNLSVMSASGAAHQPFRSTSSSSAIDNLPDDEPNPDAFKIFNLCPTVPRISPSTAPSLTPGVPTVFPPVSAPVAAGYIQGPIAGFPPGMVISPNLLPLSFPYSQHPSVMQGLLAQKHSPQTSPLPRHPHLSHSSSGLMAAQSARRNSMASEEAAATAYLKKQQQQREFYLKKKQQQQQQQLESHRQQQYFRQSQQQTVPRAHPAHQQPPSLSGQVYQPQPRPLQSHPYDHQQVTLPGPSDQLYASRFSSSVAVTSSAAGPSGHLMSYSSPSPGRPSKGLHKRSNTLYQCPYCPVMVTLKVLEVASHIQQHHPGKQVTFRKIV